MQKKVLALTRALEFYGNVDNWSEPYMRAGEMGAQALKPMHNDYGNIAREVLANLDKKEESSLEDIVCHYCGFKLNFLVSKNLKFMIDQNNNCLNCNATQHEWSKQ